NTEVSATSLHDALPILEEMSAGSDLDEGILNTLEGNVVLRSPEIVEAANRQVDKYDELSNHIDGIIQSNSHLKEGIDLLGLAVNRLTGAMTGLVGNIANDSFIRSLEKVSADLEDIVSDPQMRRVLAYTIQKESSGNFGALNKSTRPGGENQGVGMAFGAVQFT